MASILQWASTEYAHPTKVVHTAKIAEKNMLVFLFVKHPTFVY
jgi:hypothetical protein